MWRILQEWPNAGKSVHQTTKGKRDPGHIPLKKSERRCALESYESEFELDREIRDRFLRERQPVATVDGDEPVDWYEDWV